MRLNHLASVVSFLVVVSAMPVAAQVTQTDSMAGLSASSFTCGLTRPVGVNAGKPGKAVWCWGKTAEDTVFRSHLDPGARVRPQLVEGLESGIVAVATGGSHACAITVAGAAKCWGDNRGGQLGNGTTSTTRVRTPVQVTGLDRGVRKIAAGMASTCALLETNTVHCWGANSAGQLGDGSTTTRTVPTPVASLSDVVDIDLLAFTVCAVTRQGSVWCWGLNRTGQLGDGTTENRSTPVRVADLTDAKSIGVGETKACAVTAPGTVKCWGANHRGALGVGATTDLVLTPRQVVDLRDVARVDVSSHACALLRTGELRCWGSNEYGQLGDGSSASRQVTPMRVAGLANVSEIAVGWLHTCAASSSGKVWCWGDNRWGTLGDGTIRDKRQPSALANFDEGWGVARLVRTLPTGKVVKFSDDGRYLAVGNESTVALIDPQSGNTIRTFQAARLVQSLALSSGNMFLAAGTSGTNEIFVWEVATGQLVARLPHHTNTVHGLAFHPSKPMVLISVSDDRTMRFWDFETANFNAQTGDDRLRALAVSRLAGVAVGTWQTGVALLPLEGGSTHLPHGKVVITDLDFSPSGKLLAVGTNGNGVSVWETNPVRLQHTFSAYNVATEVEFLDNETLIMGGYDRTLRFINVEKRLVMRQLSPGEAFWSMSLSGSTLAIAMASGGVKIYDVYRNR